MDEPLRDRADILKAQRGDREAYARLVERYARRVHDVARRMLRDAHEAEDVTQHAFWNAWRALDRFDTDRPFQNWLLRITTNLCRNRLAARGRGKEPRARGGEDMHPEPPARPASPASETAPSSTGVRQGIEALPERYRLPVILHYLQGLPLAAIAEITDTRVATVKTWLHRGRAALRAWLAERETQEPDEGTTR